MHAMLGQDSQRRSIDLLTIHADVMTARGQHPRDFGGGALVAAAHAPLADEERDPQRRRPAMLLAAVLLAAFACREPERVRPAEQAIVEAASQPASRPADLREVRGATLA